MAGLDQAVQPKQKRHKGNAPHNDFLTGVKDGAGDVVEVATAGVHLPSLGIYEGGQVPPLAAPGPAKLAHPQRPKGTVHAPQLHLAVVCAGHDERHRGVEGCPVHPSVVALEDMLRGHHQPNTGSMSVGGNGAGLSPPPPLIPHPPGAEP
jgi:hypothetical protein